MKRIGKSYLKVFVYIVVVLNVYVFLAILIASPCEDLNRASGKFNGTAEIDGNLIYPAGTLLCVSNNHTLNAMSYYVFWPVWKFVESRGFAYYNYRSNLD